MSVIVFRQQMFEAGTLGYSSKVPKTESRVLWRLSISTLHSRDIVNAELFSACFAKVKGHRM
jgi:hypothetical protein